MTKKQKSHIIGLSRRLEVLSYQMAMLDADRKPLTNWQWELVRKKCDYKKLRREYLDYLGGLTL